MADELEKLINGEGEKPKEPSAEVKPEAPKKSEEVLKKEQELANLETAKREALAELQKIRKQTKAVKTGVELEDELPKIDFEDPNSKAWDKHFSEKVSPLATELERERDEVTGLAIREFLTDKPALAANQEKMKEFVANYEALSKARGITGRNKDVVMSVMDSAYAATLHEEVLAEARKQKVREAQANSLLADVATDSGSSSYRNERKVRRELGTEERELVIKMYGSEDAYWQSFDKMNTA